MMNCSKISFLCKEDSLCISHIQVCDGNLDCFSGEDERNCPNLISFTCNSFNRVIPYQQVCDYQYDCSDKSDEVYCSKIYLNKNQYFLIILFGRIRELQI